MPIPDMETFNYKDKKAVFEVSGNGRPLILMHGWGCNKSTVRSLANMAAECGWKVYNVDFPGFGESEEPEEIWGVEDYTRFIEELCRRNNITNPALVGHSFGGRVAVLYASRNKVDRIILVDAAGIKPYRSIKYYLKVYSYKFSKRIGKYFLSGNKYNLWLEKKRQKNGSADYASASSVMRGILSKVVNEDLSKEMSLIKAPVLLMWGENDTATPLKHAKKMEKLIPDAGLVTFPNAGHYSFLDVPIAFNRVFRHFLSLQN